MDRAFCSTPIAAPPDTRSGQVKCPMNRYCVEGVAYSCGLPHCWPVIASATAREGGPIAQREYGLSNGDELVVVFNQNTTTPAWNTSTFCYQALAITSHLGTISCSWESRTTLIIRIVDATTRDDTAVTRVGVLSLSVQILGNLRWVAVLACPRCRARIVASQAREHNNAASIHADAGCDRGNVGHAPGTCNSGDNCARARVVAGVRMRVG